MKTICNRKKSAGRPAGSRTRYPGIKTFAAKHHVSHQFVRAVLDGHATSGPVLRNWARFQAARELGA